MANDKAKAAQRRQSDAGRMARQVYNQRPDVKAHKAIIRAIKKQTKGGR